MAGISRRFGAVQALSGVDLTVAAGEVVALAGENGSGKSTLSRILSGVLTPDSGSVHLGDARCSFSHPRQALDAGITMVSQEPTSVPHLSVAENVLLPRLHRAAQRVSRRELIRDAAPFLQRVGLMVDPARMLGSLGQGERELVELAKAIAVHPHILVLDEVTTRLPDPERLFRVVDELAASGVGVVFITHRLREIRRLATRAVVLRDGRLVAELDRSELTDERISAAMVGRALTEFFHKAEPAVGEPVLEVDGLVTDRWPAPVSMAVRRGEIVGLAGLVGSGRSELLETMAGARRPRAGTVTVDGKPLRPGHPRAARVAGVGLVPEDRFAQALLRPGSVTANLSLASHRLTRRTDRRAERGRASEAIRSFGIRCSGLDAPVSSLSGGNAQKVVIARALAGSPRVLLLDEPTRGVDVGARAEIYAILSGLVRDGMGVLLASSDLLELRGLCDRILVLHDGEVAGELTRSQATEEAIALLSAGGGRHDAAGAQAEVGDV